MINFKPHGVCSRNFTFEIENNKISFISAEGGCDGNLKGICSLLTGMEVAEAIAKLKGIKCGNKDTSCPDQISLALESYKNK